MMLAVLLLALLGAVLALLARAWTTPAAPAPARPGTESLEVYRAQLSEVEAQARMGFLSAAEAEASRAEIGRRALAAAEIRPESAQASGLAGEFGIQGLVAALSIAALAIGLYASLGRPQLPDHPAAATAIQASAPASEADRLIGLVEARLRETPEDGRGWDALAPVYLHTDRYRAAAEAYANAIRLIGVTPDRLSGLAEASILAAGGRVTPEARKTAEALLKIEPGRAEARFWLALGKEQDGDIAAAIADYKALLASSPADAPWRPLVEKRLAAASGATEPAAPVMPDAATIEAMVAGLAQRLGDSAHDLEGWQRLVRSYVVLGRTDEAQVALAKALKIFAAEPSSQAALKTLAQNLGLGS